MSKAFPWDVWKKLGELGLIGMGVPAEDRGYGADCITEGIAAEAVGRGDPSKGFDVSRVYLALLCLGAAAKSVEETIEYTKGRTAFQKPLAQFEGVSFTVVEHAAMLEAVWLLCYKALSLRDQGLPHTKEAAMVKWMGPRFSVDAIRDCLLLHGHYGRCSGSWTAFVRLTRFSRPTPPH